MNYLVLYRTVNNSLNYHILYSTVNRWMDYYRWIKSSRSWPNVWLWTGFCMELDTGSWLVVMPTWRRHIWIWKVVVRHSALSSQIFFQRAKAWHLQQTLTTIIQCFLEFFSTCFSLTPPLFFQTQGKEISTSYVYLMQKIKWVAHYSQPSPN